MTAAILFLADALIDGSGAPPQRPGAVLVDGERIRAGADVVKIAASGGPRSMVPHFSQEELLAPIPPDIGQWPHDAPVPFRMLQLEER